MDTRLQALFRPFELQALDWPQAGHRALIFGAGAGFGLDDNWYAKTEFVQSFRPDYNFLARSGFSVHRDIPDGEFDYALVLLDRHKQLNRHWVRQGLKLLREGGVLVICGRKTEGVQPLRSWLADAFEIEGKSAKGHAVSFWLQKSDSFSHAQELLLADPDEKRIEHRYVTGPGLFSENRIDDGSALLAAHLPVNLRGRVADFCAGWGYLSDQLASRCEAITQIDLYEAEERALVAARANLSRLHPKRKFGYCWQDLCKESVEDIYRTIVMNPPFHQGRAAEPDLGRRIIAAAASALSTGGQLWLVANRQLPYEQDLSNLFNKFEIIADTGRYKLLFAMK